MRDGAGDLSRAEFYSGAGPLSGPTYAYRGALLDGNASGTLFQITLVGSTIDGWKGSCDLDTACNLVDCALVPIAAVRTDADKS
jgi:hypothetical protein